MRSERRLLLLSIVVIYAISLTGCAKQYPILTTGHASNMTLLDSHTLVGEKHLVQGYPPLDSLGNINVVVEIPTGTNAKWEVEKASGGLKWEFKKGKPRMVSYLGYPGNYGMIPGTLLPKELGGDGDPLDVLVIGSAIPRGSVVSARTIGILKLFDNGEQDDKVIAVLPGSYLANIYSIEDLKREFKGVAEIIQIWFSNYKGQGKMQSKGFANVAEAQKVIKAAVDAYSNQKQLSE